MRKLGILFLLFFFGLTPVLSASNTPVDTSGSADFITDAKYLQIINSASESVDQKCCIKTVLDDKQKSSTCQSDAKLFVVSELALGRSQELCIHSTLASQSPVALSWEFHRPPIA